MLTWDWDWHFSERNTLYPTTNSKAANYVNLVKYGHVKETIQRYEVSYFY